MRVNPVGTTFKPLDQKIDLLIERDLKCQQNNKIFTHIDLPKFFTINNILKEKTDSLEFVIPAEIYKEIGIPIPDFKSLERGLEISIVLPPSTIEKKLEERDLTFESKFEPVFKNTKFTPVKIKTKKETLKLKKKTELELRFKPVFSKFVYKYVIFNAVEIVYLKGFYATEKQVFLNKPIWDKAIINKFDLKANYLCKQQDLNLYEKKEEDKNFVFNKFFILKS